MATITWEAKSLRRSKEDCKRMAMKKRGDAKSVYQLYIITASDTVVEPPPQSGGGRLLIGGNSYDITQPVSRPNAKQS